jgi:predicted metalloprotease with PDZ domain
MKSASSRFSCARAGTVAVCALLAWAPSVAAEESLRYVLTPHFGEGRLHVELSWQTGGRRQSALRVSERVGPIRDVPGMLRNMRCSSGFRRQGAVWVLSHRPEEVVQCAYDVVPQRRAFDDWDYIHAPITTADFFHGLGNAFLLVPNSGPDVPEEFEVVMRWKLPAGYQAVCSWGVGRHIGARIKATDLRHSVYLAGRLAKKTVKEGERSLTVAMVDRFGFSLDEFAQMTSTIIKHQCDFMLEDNFPDFVVTAIPVGEPLKPGEARLAGSGLYNSFALFLAPEAELDDAVEHLFAHELFHYWNGRLLQAEQPERLVYWFVEGFTDYYALRILYESGYWDAAKYAKWINRHVREYYQNPAINALNEDINRDYWNKRRTVGEVAYQRGLLLGLRWHRLARKNGISDGVDRLFKALVNRGRSGGFQVSNHAIRQVGGELLGAWFTTEFDRFVAKAETIDIPADALSPALVGKLTEVYAYELGFDQTRSLADRKVRGLVSGSAAEKAGLREGDRLLGWSLQSDPDMPTRLQVQRGGRAETITYYPRGDKRVVLQFQPSG